MRKQLLYAALFTVISIKSYAQIVFERGHIINESNQRIDCLIKNMDWQYNPTRFDYKLSPDAAIQSGDIGNVKEFGIDSVFKYVRAIVNMDISSDELDNMSTVKNPIFQEEKIFLKVLIDGKATLYTYKKGKLTRFFYKIDGSEIKQLVYKNYLVDMNHIGQNDYFRQQLSMDVTCQDTRLNDFKSIQYNTRDLERFFENYNECSKSSYINYDFKQKKHLFNLSVRPGLNFSDMAIKSNATDSKSVDFGNKVSFRLGIEAEFILPYNKNKWSILLEPTFQYFKSEKTTKADNVSGGILVSTVNYRSIELPVGVRYYWFLKDKSKIFINGSYVFDFPVNSSIKFRRSDGSELNSLNINAMRNLALGAGYKYKNKYSVEFRFDTNRKVLGNYLNWNSNSNYKTVSIIFGYTVF